MEIYFKVTASYRTEEEDSKGNLKVVKHKDNYLVKSTELFTDAEARATKAVSEIGGTNQITVDSLSKSNIQNVYNHFEGDKYYEVSMTLHWEDDKGKPKKDTHVDLILANDLKSAIENALNVYEDSLSDYEVTKALESKILDVFEIEQQN